VACSFAFSKHRLRTLGPCWVRDSLGVGILELVGEPLELVREQVPVVDQRHRRRGMAELGLDRLDARALGGEQARAGVAKVMEAPPAGESSPAAAGLKMPATTRALPRRRVAWPRSCWPSMTTCLSRPRSCMTWATLPHCIDSASMPWTAPVFRAQGQERLVRLLPGHASTDRPRVR
jgi:hypothetical protein